MISREPPDAVSMQKICDAKDFFEPRLSAIIRFELEDIPTLHRKQWEFAAIFDRLNELGALRPDSKGFSMGSGNERVLYAIARRCASLTATDLYDQAAAWETARTADATAFVRDSNPLSTPAANIDARVMDMRQLEFDDDSFDFAYSSCAFEHIGYRADFARHLAETCRVLKPGGLYVFTTELVLEGDTIENPGCHYFSIDYLRQLIYESPFQSLRWFDTELTPCVANMPMPLGSLDLWSERDEVRTFLAGQLYNILLLGNVPLTSAILVLRKPGAGEAADGWFDTFEVRHSESAQAFVRQSVARTEALVNASELRPNPMGFMPGRVSRFVAPSAMAGASEAGDQVFHTPYLWLGSGAKTAAVRFDVLAAGERADEHVELRVHRLASRRPWEVELVVSRQVPLQRGVDEALHFEADRDYLYAIVGTPHVGASFQIDLPRVAIAARAIDEAPGIDE